MTGSVVHLDICEAWWRWGGFGSYPLSDTKDSHSANAFPSLKPDMDIFGIPRRSRKQRGWYQIKHHMSGISAIQGSQSAPAASAADIPPELFNTILAAYVLTERERARKLDSSFIADKRQLGACGLVCRHWAAICQKKIYRNIIIRSRQDIYQLVDFVKSPISRVRGYISATTIPAQKLGGSPWIHILSTTPLSVDGFRNFSIALEGPLPLGQKTLRSIHQALPRSFPEFSSRISHLSLNDIHFKSLDDLIHLAWEIPSMTELKCSRVTWDTLPRTLPCVAADIERTKRPVEYFAARMSQCSPSWSQAAIWLAETRRRRRTRADRFCTEEDMTRIFALVRCVEACVTDAPNVFHGVFSIPRNTFDGDDGVWTDIIGFELWRTQALIESPFDPGSWVEFLDYQDLSRCEREDTPHDGECWRIDSIIINTAKSLDSAEIKWMNVDWKTIDETVSSFPHLQRVVLGFDSREEMMFFVEEIARPKLRLLNESGKLKYAIDGQDGWFRASPESDNMYQSHIYALAEVYTTYKATRYEFVETTCSDVE